jgi:hypothetical protein
VAGERSSVPPPVFRRLRVFAVDPGMTARFETAVINEMTVQVPWEDLAPGPSGEYVAVVDQNDSGTQLHPPIDLDQSEVLAHSGLPPSDGNPQFRQQMVYAVAMKTIGNFERALGRPAHWPPERKRRGKPAYRPQLRLYPHYMVDADAHYELERGLCFGYFESAEDSPVPGMSVFTCLSQDAIAHEITHALLYGMNIEFGNSGDEKGDDAALHEAFSDLIALFQHFGESDVLREQIAVVRGNLDERSLLGAVALQMGQATGKPDGIRNALGFTDAQGMWHARVPDPKAYRTTADPHQRGDILVGTVFEAFKKIYESRVADLRRIATKGTGVLPPGHVHPDLVNRLAHEASESARHVLHMCIRALDYLPPIDVTFGDFLRAIVTADHDLVPTDERHYRVAFIDAFRSYGIVPSEVGTLSVDTLLWCRPDDGAELGVIADFVRQLSKQTTYWNLPRARHARWEVLEDWKHELAAQLKESKGRARILAGLDLSKPLEVRSLDVRERAGLAGTVSMQWVIKIVQKSRRAACTLLVDAESGEVRYLVEKPAAANGKADILKRAGVGTRPLPAERRLRVFAFDPSLGTQLETAGINEVTLKVPWERDARGSDALEAGPIGEYLEIIDRDPASGCFYSPVDLNESRLVAQDGLPPSEANPQFHQQMVYAVTMRIIRDFEGALGRLALWAPHRVQVPGPDGKPRWQEEFVRRLRVYPHALREPNAYYSPAKKALLFGYFPAPTGAGGPELTVFTSLSHDIVAHEVTHALLDGIHRRFNEPSNPDVLAFHEAFADIVALFEHFSLPEVLRQQIAATRGDLASQNRLGELAQQFGQAIGRRGALRDAIGETDPATGRWKPIEPDPGAYWRLHEPHQRGALLVAAVFDAFLTIYKARVADLLRIATEGTGVLPEGHLHPDLVNRLADEAARSARHVLHMCIRALDYCPPVDITFGDYLRAVVTADFEHNPVDDAHRRVAFVEAFRRYGIVPEDIRTLSVDGLLWRSALQVEEEDENVILSEVKEWNVFIGSWSLTRDRTELFDLMRRLRRSLHSYLDPVIGGTSEEETFEVLGGLDPMLKFEVHSVRPSMGTDWNGSPRFHWVIELTQRIAQYVDGDGQNDGRPPFYFRGGCTLLVDAETGKVRYSIKKPLNQTRRERQLHYYLHEGNESLAATYFGPVNAERGEQFAMLHRSQ